MTVYRLMLTEYTTAPVATRQHPLTISLSDGHVYICNTGPVTKAASAPRGGYGRLSFPSLVLKLPQKLEGPAKICL